MRTPTILLAVCVAGGCPAATAAAPAETQARFLIEPGPTVQSAEEKALVADPARGMQHGVILMEEILRDESGIEDRIVYHMRAKVLSSDMRGLGEISVPVKRIRAGAFRKWWARNILPDGTVIELKREDLKEEVVLDAGVGFKNRSVKGALPGVQIGSVIDYGYELRGSYFDWYDRIPLQHRIFLKTFRYKWVPYKGFGASYYVRRRPDLNVKVTKGDDSTLIEAFDMPPVEEEPYMPPDDTVRASVLTYYWADADLPAEQGAFWKAHAKNTERAVAEFLKKDDGIEEAVAELGLAPEEGLVDKARAAYDWAQQNVRNLSLLTAEEKDAKVETDRERRRRHAYAYLPQDNAASVLRFKEGTEAQINHLFIGMMRALGAEAHEVLAPNREFMLWDERMLIPWQLMDSFVFVKARGDADEKGLYLSPGSGLPFGTIESWVAPSVALLTDETGGRRINVPTLPAEQNVLATRARISFPVDGSAAAFVWSGTETGQRGIWTRRILTGTPAEVREEYLEGYCGAGGDVDIIKAEAPGFADITSVLRVECVGEHGNLPFDPDADTMTFHADGAWIPGVPSLVATERAHPIVMPYARTDRTSIEVKAPEGFHPSAPPPKVSYQSAVGRYELKVAVRGDAFHVDRTLTLPLIAMKKEAYPELRRFLTDVRIADDLLLEFRRVENP